jgi:hypothetical protein
MDKIATMADLAIGTTGPVKSIMEAIVDLGERINKHKDEFVSEMKEMKQRMDMLEYKLNISIALAVIGFAILWYNINCMDAKFEAKFINMDAKFENKFANMEAKFEARFNNIEAKIDSLQHLLIQILLSKNHTLI